MVGTRGMYREVYLSSIPSLLIMCIWGRREYTFDHGFPRRKQTENTDTGVSCKIAVMIVETTAA